MRLARRGYLQGALLAGILALALIVGAATVIDGWRRIVALIGALVFASLARDYWRAANDQPSAETQSPPDGSA